MAVLIYLLARFLFKRRTVAVIAALLVLADGMMFANARIAMNDTYVAFFIVAAFTLFVPVWLGRWRNPVGIAAALLGVGVFLGLALASKWVGAYAIGGIGLLILFRSALGRWIALVAMIAMTAVLGYIAITPNPEVENPQLNYLFLFLMLGLTALLAAGDNAAAHPHVARRAAPRDRGSDPCRDRRDRHRRLPPGQSAGGRDRLGDAGCCSASVLVALGVGVAAAAWVGARYGYGPWATGPHVDSEREPASPPPDRGWLRPGSGILGLPWLLAFAAITVVPLIVYTLSYIPWIDLGNQWVAGVPAGHTGQTFLDLQKSMYEYHNYLRATHPASSPWWAWPLDLKPVWFEQNDYAGGTTAVIYDTGNLVLFWLGDPGRRVAQLHGMEAAQPPPDGRGHRDGRVVAAVGAHRPRHVPVPHLHHAAVRLPGARLLPGRAVARAVGADVGTGACRGGNRRHRAAVCCGCCDCRCAGSRARKRSIPAPRCAPTCLASSR